MQLKDFVDFLVFKSGMNISELANELNISRQTLSNWRNGRINKIDTETATKLEGAMRRNHWGIRLGSVTRSNIEIINTTDQAKAELQKQTSDKSLADDIIKNQISYIKNLEQQISTLKEELEKYKVR